MKSAECGGVIGSQLLEKEAAHDMRELVTSAVTTQLKCPLPPPQSAHAHPGAAPPS